MKITNSKANFSSSAARFMNEHYHIDLKVAKDLMTKYIDEIDVNDHTTQQLGADYFAIQILMAENIIPYKPM